MSELLLNFGGHVANLLRPEDGEDRCLRREAKGVSKVL